MTIHQKIFGVVATFIFVCGTIGPIVVFAATAPSLGAAASYAVLSSTYTNTSATTITGDVGFTTPPAIVPSGVQVNYGLGAPYSAAGTDQGTSLASLNNELCTFTFGAGAINLSTDTTHGTAGIFVPGVYCSAGAMNIGGPLTLDGNGVYIFRSLGALTSTAGAVVSLTGGASACDIFWTPSEAVTLAANTTFVGTVIDAAGITVGANTSWTGQALAFGGTVTTNTTTLSVPVCTSLPATLHIITVVDNTGGGVATAAQFNVHVKFSGADVLNSPAVGLAMPGTSYSLSAGSYIVSEEVNASYTQSFSGDCSAIGVMDLAIGADKTCTVTNTYIPVVVVPATLHVIKTVVNTGGGVAIASDFNLHVKNSDVDVLGSPAVGLIAPGTSYSLVPGTYVLSETANASYAQTVSGDCDVSGSIVLASSAEKTCIMTNTYIIPPVSGGGGSGGGGGGGGSSYFPSPISLIGISKVPSPLSLPNGSGSVTYDYTVWNAGIKQALTGIVVQDDLCSPVVYLTGDVDGNKKLEPLENWKYRCVATLAKTTTNTATASGYGDESPHMKTVETVSATVVVSPSSVSPLVVAANTPGTPISPVVVLKKTPKFPNTGFYMEEKNDLLGMAGSFVSLIVLIILTIIYRKKFGNV